MRGLVLLTLSIAPALAGILAGCKNDACKSVPPSFELDLSADPAIASAAQSLTVTLTIGSDHYRNTYELTRELAGGSTSLVVKLDNPAPTADFAADVTVLAYDMRGGFGRMLGGGAEHFSGSPDGCNHFALSLKPGPLPDGGVPDGGQPDLLDVGTSDQGPRPGTDGGPAGGDGGVTFDYPPSNFMPGALAMVSGGVDLSCPMAIIDTDALDFSNNWCGQPAPSVSMAMQQNPGAVVLAVSGLHVGPNTTVHVVGSRAVILAIFGDGAIEGAIDATAIDTRPGAGGSNMNACMGSIGGDTGGAAGGGGGGYGTAGGTGGQGGQGETGGSPGMISNGANDAAIVPLRGGCSGGSGGDGGRGGQGGGAIQISSARTLSVTGRVLAGGGGGTGGDRDNNGGGGGGSGGAILLEARDLEIGATAQLAANGGGGGGGGGTSGPGLPGMAGQAAGGGAGGVSGSRGGRGGRGGSVGALPGDGQPARDQGAGGGGGGGAAGRIRLNGSTRCSLAGHLSPVPSRGGSCP